MIAGIAQASESNCNMKDYRNAVMFGRVDSYCITCQEKELAAIKACYGEPVGQGFITSQEKIDKLIVRLEENIKKGKADQEKEAAVTAKYEKEAARLKTLPGASIGMSASQVLNKTSWGRPGQVNRTTTATGTTEQWVYGYGNYLYFRNGVLYAIQN